ncbi:MAG: hypothetical protein WBV22_06140 [Anaerolineaceae bacterium]
MRFFTLISRDFLNSQSLLNELKNTHNLVAGISVIAYEVIDHDLYLCIESQGADEEVAPRIGDLIGSFKDIPIDDVWTGWSFCDQATFISDYYYADKLSNKPINGKNEEYKQYLVIPTLIGLGAISFFLAYFKAFQDAFRLPIVIVFIIAGLAMLILSLTQSIQRISAEETSLEVKMVFGSIDSFNWEDIEAVDVHPYKAGITLKLTTKTDIVSYRIIDFMLKGANYPIFKTIGCRAGLVVLEIQERDLRMGKPYNWEIVIEN